MIISRGITFRCYDGIGYTPETCVEDGVITHAELPDEVSDPLLAEQIALVRLAAAKELQAQQSGE